MKEDINNFSKTNNAVGNEAIRKFARKLRRKAHTLCFDGNPISRSFYINEKDIDVLLQKMEGGEEE